MVYFVGNCTFKTDLPGNVINHRLRSYIKQHLDPVVSNSEINRIVERLKKLQSDPSLTTENHIKSLEERLNSDTVCPRFSSDLVERIARNGSQDSSSFVGCSNYPRCRFTKDI